MRVNPNAMPNLLAALNQNKLFAQKAALEVATGQRVNQPSDDPTAAALLIDNNDQATFNTSYLKSIQSVQGQLSIADSTLSSIGTVLQQAITLGLSGTATLTDSGRATIANEIQGAKDQFLSLTNSSYGGNRLFAGTATATPPFVADSASPSGITYVGNTGVNQVPIGSGYTIATNMPGSQLFTAPGHDVFLAMSNLITALQTNTGIPAAITSLTAANAYVSAQRAFYGNATNQATAQTATLNANTVQIGQQAVDIGGADFSTAATNLTQAQVGTQATLAAIAKFAQNSLFDFLK